MLSLERNDVQRHILYSIDGLAGIIVLAPKPIMLVLYDVRNSALNTSIHGNCPMRRGLACYGMGIPLMFMCGVPVSD